MVKKLIQAQTCVSKLLESLSYVCVFNVKYFYYHILTSRFWTELFQSCLDYKFRTIFDHEMVTLKFTILTYLARHCLEGKKISEQLSRPRFLPGFEPSRPFSPPVSHGEKSGKFQKPVKVAHKAVVLIFLSL